jgi:hypothetical protein
MKLVIIPDDGAVYIDGVCHSELDLSTAPDNVHALQWKNDKGWIEFKDNDDGTKPQNESITELPQWANACIDAWNAWVEPMPLLENPMPATVLGGE